jgi:4,5-dihydroxyphthalate decarboxylase
LRVAPLFPDPIAVEKAWFAASRHFPIMHAVGVRKTLLAAHAGLGRRLFAAFLTAKNIAVADLEVTQVPKITLPWPETQLRWSRLDGLQGRAVALDELFAADCLATSPAGCAVSDAVLKIT